VGRWVFRNTFPQVDLYIANSLMTADTLVSYGCDRSRIRVIPPPVDADRFRPGLDGSALRRQWTEDGAAGPVLLTVCRLDDVGKGIDTVFQVLPRLKERFPEIRYVVLGGGPSREKYERMARELGVDRHVIFAGRISDAELPLCYAACDVFLLLSRRVPTLGYYEGFGIVYREAMACGKPVIVSKEAGFRDYVTHGEDALLVKPTDLEEVRQACTDLLENPAAAASMGERARGFASRRTDWSPLNEFA